MACLRAAAVIEGRRGRSLQPPAQLLDQQHVRDQALAACRQGTQGAGTALLFGGPRLGPAPCACDPPSPLVGAQYTRLEPSSPHSMARACQGYSCVMPLLAKALTTDTGRSCCASCSLMARVCHLARHA
jgi:hypothetical protein